MINGRCRGRGDGGAIAIVVAIFMVVAMILMAFVVDRGRVYVLRGQLQHAVDAAALAGAQSFCGGIGDPEAIAIQYAAQNGAPGASVLLSPVSDPEYINVRAQQSLDSFFGAFVSDDVTNVAAQATARNTCTAVFQFVATEWFEITGSRNRITTDIYAGYCFAATGTENYFDAKIAVSDIPDLNNDGVANEDCNDVNNRFTSAQVDLGGDPQKGPNYGVVPHVQDLTAIAAWNSVPYNQMRQFYGSDPSTLIPTTPCGNYSGPFASDVLHCGKIAVGQNDSIAGSLLSRDQIDFNNNFDGWPADNPGTPNPEILIYSAYSGTQPAISLPQIVPPNVIIYAPNARVKVTGDGAGMQGTVYAKSIEVSGGGAEFSAGTEIEFNGEVQLVQ